jgi:hypothetical protein
MSYRTPSHETLIRWGFADGKAGKRQAFPEEAYRIAYIAGRKMASFRSATGTAFKSTGRA